MNDKIYKNEKTDKEDNGGCNLDKEDNGGCHPDKEDNGGCNLAENKEEKNNDEKKRKKTVPTWKKKMPRLRV